jgi:hypothetical protein
VVHNLSPRQAIASPNWQDLKLAADCGFPHLIFPVLDLKMLHCRVARQKLGAGRWGLTVCRSGGNAMGVIARRAFSLTIALLVPVASPAADDGFVSLFDGKTLNGWTVCYLPKDAKLAAKAWTVERGTILADTMGHREQFYIWLATNKEYGDFVLRLRFQCERNAKGNSGIQIRSRYIAETGWMEGPQIDIDPPNPRGTTGKLWNEGPGEHRWLSNEPVSGLKFFYADEGDGWNDLEITAKGMRIKSVLNGVTVVDYDGSGVLDDELHKKHDVGTRGLIGLQIHQHDEVKLRFKDIRIKEL